MLTCVGGFSNDDFQYKSLEFMSDTHKVKPQESLLNISKQYKCKPIDIINENPEIKGLLRLNPGMLIKLPNEIKTTLDYFG